MKNKVTYYINGLGIISPQKTFNNDTFLNEIAEYDGNVLKCITPEFKEYINPIQLRRLSRMLRIGLSAATICVRDTGDIKPDGIITATGYGFLDDTAKFLTELLQQNEKQLTPTFFMQSTYNALAGLVALTFKCKGYNNTYVSKGFAFETAIYDAMMQLNENASQTFLIGSYDETDDVQYKINSRVGHYKSEYINNLQLYESNTGGTLQGEGAAFFSISGNKGSNAWCILNGMKMIHRPEKLSALEDALNSFLVSNKTSIQDIDILVSGESGDVVNDQLISGITKNYFRDKPQLHFKHLTGEYCTASSFGLWIGASVLKKQQVPAILKANKIEQTDSINAILIVNQYMDRNYSFMLLNSI